jgi:hypothetical protein
VPPFSCPLQAVSLSGSAVASVRWRHRACVSVCVCVSVSMCPHQAIKSSSADTFQSCPGQHTGCQMGLAPTAALCFQAGWVFALWFAKIPASVWAAATRHVVCVFVWRRGCARVCVSRWTPRFLSSLLQPHRRLSIMLPPMWRRDYNRTQLLAVSQLGALRVQSPHACKHTPPPPAHASADAAPCSRPGTGGGSRQCAAVLARQRSRRRATQRRRAAS